MKMKLGKKLFLAFTLVAVGVVLITGIVSKYRINDKFDEYLTNQHEDDIKIIISKIEESYDEDDNVLNIDTNMLKDYAYIYNLYIKVNDLDGREIYSSSKESIIPKMNGLGKNRTEKNMMGNYNFGEYIEEKYDISIDSNVFGELTIGYFGVNNLNYQDVIFKSTLTESFLISMIIAIAFGIIISIIISKGITNPIIKITKVCHKIRNGDYKTREEVKTNTIELEELSNSINYLAESLDKQDMLRKRLTSDMAHEIRTPLTTLQNSMEAILDGIIEPTNNRIESCHEEIIRIAKLTDRLKDISNLEQANLNLNKSKVEIEQELISIIENMRPLFAKKNIELDVDIRDKSEIFIDRDKFKQIIINLLSNAYRYTNENGKVVVKEIISKKMLEIEICDNGIGISNEDMPYIFERFYRGDSSRSRETGGSGIGLTIVKSLVEAHDGKIEVMSQFGKGSVFKIYMPV
ncbi:MAG: ATP-binding protein [Clostridiaceae bacterium]